MASVVTEDILTISELTFGSENLPATRTAGDFNLPLAGVDLCLLEDLIHRLSGQSPGTGKPDDRLHVLGERPDDLISYSPVNVFGHAQPPQQVLGNTDNNDALFLFLSSHKAHPAQPAESGSGIGRSCA